MSQKLTQISPFLSLLSYVATTKYDSRHKVPYSCILRSLSQILQQILSESEEEIHSFYNHLKSHLGAQFYNIELLADLVPELKPLLDPVDSEDSEEPINAIHLDNVETRIRFHNLFIEVFRALAQWRMITLVSVYGFFWEQRGTKYKCTR